MQGVSSVLGTGTTKGGGGEVAEEAEEEEESQKGGVEVGRRLRPRASPVCISSPGGVSA